MEDYKDTLGYVSAMDELNDDPDLKLYETEIGLFDLQDDPHTAYDSVMVVVAADNWQQANENAQMLCEDTIPVVRSIAFAPMTQASEINPE
jgi:hypothetical protein